MYLVSVHVLFFFNTTPNPTSSSFFQNVFVLIMSRNAIVKLDMKGAGIIICQYLMVNEDIIVLIVLFMDSNHACNMLCLL